MSDHTELYQETIRKVTENMHTNNEWASRYAGYISAINNIGAEIKQADSKFGFAKNLDIYLPVSKAKQANSRTVYFDVRYKGQSVAELRVNNKQEVTICCKTDTNMRDYLGYPSDLQDISNKELVDWHGQKARAFRKFFAGSPERKNGNNLEHKRVCYAFAYTWPTPFVMPGEGFAWPRFFRGGHGSGSAQPGVFRDQECTVHHV